MEQKSQAEIQFEQEKRERLAAYANDAQWKKETNAWIKNAFDKQYMYNFSWMGRPCIQFPQDMIAMQQLIWDVKPDLIIETGVAHGGSSVMYASILELMGKGKVISIDIDIRPHNRKALEEHPMIKRIELIESSSVDKATVSNVAEQAKNAETVLVVLDSNHTHEHVLAELNAYAELVSVGSYVVVFDTIVEVLPEGYFDNRPWDVGDSPMTALDEFIEANPNFVVDADYDNMMLISAAPRGYLKRVS